MAGMNKGVTNKRTEEAINEEHTSTMDMTWTQTDSMMIPLDTPNHLTMQNKRRRTSILVDSNKREALDHKTIMKRRVSFAPTAHVRLGAQITKYIHRKML